MSSASYIKIYLPDKTMRKFEGTELQEVRLAASNASLNQDATYSYIRERALRQSQVKNIAWSASLLTLPLLILTVALLSMIFGFQIKSDQAPFTHLSGNHSDSVASDAFYVNLPSTFLIFVASWMSSLAPISIGLAMSLALYPVADRFFHDSMSVDTASLPTPYQFAIALKFAAGSIWNGLLDLTHYRTAWETRVPTHGRVLVSLTRIGCLVLALTLLVLGADTWLHIVTKTVPFVQLTAILAENAKYSYSLLSPNCTSTDNTFSSMALNNLTCTIDPNSVKLQNGLTAIQVLNDQSDTIRIYNDGPDPTLAYLGIASPQNMEQYDYTATTLGMRAVCRPITQACGLGGKANSSNVFAFNCGNSSFSGELISSGSASRLQQLYYYDFDAGNFSQASTLNPYQYAVVFAVQTTANLAQSIRDDPEVYSRTIDDLLSAALLCDVTAYDVEYDMVNSSISRMVATPSNVSTVNVFTPGLMQTFYGESALQSALQLASVTATSAQDLANQYALAYSKVALSIGAGSLVQSPALQAQRRDTILVARVPKAPVLLLIAVNLIFVCLGITLTVLAMRSSHHAYQVQLRFGTSGVVAAMFGGKGAQHPVESEEHLFDEYRGNGRSDVIGVQATSGNNYMLRAVQDMDRDVRHGQSERW